MSFPSLPEIGSPKMLSRKEQDESTCQALCHSCKSGFQLVSKEGGSSSASRGDDMSQDQLKPASEQLPPLATTPSRTHRMVPVQIIESSPRHVSPPHERLFVDLPPRAAERSEFVLPHFTAINPKVTKLNRPRSSSFSREMRDSGLQIRSTGIKPMRCKNLFAPILHAKKALTFNSNSAKAESSLAPAASFKQYSLLRLDSKFESVTCEMKNDAKYQVDESHGSTTASSVSPTHKSARKTIAKKNTKAKKSVTPDKSQNEDFLTFLPKTQSMLAPAADFTFGSFKEQFRRESACSFNPIHASCISVASSMTIPKVLHRSHSSRNRGFPHSDPSSTVTITSVVRPNLSWPKHGRSEEHFEESFPQEQLGTKRKSPRLSEPSEEMPRGQTNLKSHDGFSTPTEQMLQELTTPPVLQSVHS